MSSLCLLARSWAYALSMNLDCCVGRMSGFWDAKPFATSICVVHACGAAPFIVGSLNDRSVIEVLVPSTTCLFHPM